MAKEEKKEKIKKEKKERKNTNKKKDRKSLWTRFRVFCNGVRGEFSKVHWTSKKDLIKYSVATIFFMLFSALFFYVIDVLFALVQSLI